MSVFFDSAVTALRGLPSPAYVTGGAVRDLLLRRESHDLDVVVGEAAAPVAGRLAEALGATLVVMDEARGHYRVVSGGRPASWVDISSYGADLIADLGRRDFTIGAMAVPVAAWPDDATAALVDPFGGATDLKQRVVKAVSEQNLLDDPVRLVRCVRIAHQLRFRIDPATREMVRRNAASVATAAPERVRDEVYAVFASPRPESGVRLLDALGLLSAVFPELDEARGVTQPKAHHYWDVFEHLVHCVGKAEAVLDRGAREQDAVIRLAPWRGEIEGYFEGVVADGQTRSTLLRMAALLHDVAKPRCKTDDGQGKVRFLGHREVGEEMAREMLGRWRCSRRVVSHIATLTRHHLRPPQMAPSGWGGRPSERALYRYWRDLGDVATDTLFLSLADYLASCGPDIVLQDWARVADGAGVILAGGFVARDATKPFLLLNGNEVMAELGIPPGPGLGRLLAALQSAEADGRVETREQAVEFLRGLA